MAEEAQQSSPGSEGKRGTVDLASVLYVLGGVPFLIAFFVLLFVAVGTCGDSNIQIPA